MFLLHNSPIFSVILQKSLLFSDNLHHSLSSEEFSTYLRLIDDHIRKAIKIKHTCYNHNSIAGINHIIGSVPVPFNNMCSINAEEIEERNTIPPAQKEKSTSQNSHHRQNIDHKINRVSSSMFLKTSWKHPC